MTTNRFTRWMALPVFATSLTAVASTARAVETRSVRTMASPLVRLQQKASPGVVPVRIDDAEVRRMSQQTNVRLNRFPLPDRFVDLDLTAKTVLAPAARLVLGSAAGDRPATAPDVAIFSGHIVGEPDSFAFLSLSQFGSHGWIESAGRRYDLSDGGFLHGRRPVVVDAASAAAAAVNVRPLDCGWERLPAGAAPVWPAAEHAPRPVLGSRGAAPCRVAEVAVETDYEYASDLFGGNTAAAMAYSMTLIAAISEIYERDFGTSLTISFLRVWPANDDPWTDFDCLGALFEFQDYWEANMVGEPRDIVHLLSGKFIGGCGGVAYQPGLCDLPFGYGLSAYLDGFFPYPLEDNSPFNWDLVVVAHEIGHNFYAWHTHEMDPPIDGCAFGDCSVAAAGEGTIMSYCHICPGGLANVKLRFHERNIEETVLPYLTSPAGACVAVPCDLTGDCDGNGLVNANDVTCFIDVVLGLDLDPLRQSRCDLDSSGTADGDDIQPFIAALP